MKNESSKEAITVIEGTDETAKHEQLAHGEVAYFAARSPVKETPNEDALAIIPMANNALVIVVADGMGGMPAAETLLQKPDEQPIRDAILTGIDQSNQNIRDLKTGAGSTVSIAEITENYFRSYHAGDSLILLTSSHGNIKYLPMAHSPIGYALECGAIDQVPAMLHNERNLISNYVGSYDMFIHIGPVIELAPQDTVLLATDALSDNLYEQEVSEYIRSGPLLDSVNDMITACRNNMLQVLPDRRCHPDDFTFVCFRQNN